MPIEVYYSTGELATRLDKAPRSIRRWAYDGEFGGDVVSIGGDIMVPESGVAAYLEHHKLHIGAEASAARRALMRRRLDGLSAREQSGGVSARSTGELLVLVRATERSAT